MHAVEVEYKREVLVRDKKKAITMLGRVIENEQIKHLDLFSPLKGDKVQIALCKVPGLPIWMNVRMEASTNGYMDAR